MYEAVCVAISVILLIVWIAAEIRGRTGLRIALGFALIAFVGLMWYSAELQMADMQAINQAVFRLMGERFKAGDTRTVESAVEVYNDPVPGSFRGSQALDVLVDKGNK